MNPSLQLRQLHVFEAVCTTGGFSRAAEHLGMTQPAVSPTIRQLEAELRVALFEPIGRRRLTDAGRELLKHARTILSQIRAAETAMAFHEEGEGGDGGRGPRGQLHIGGCVI
jgi:DNA-binding transcriptional LysR family regulator